MIFFSFDRKCWFSQSQSHMVTVMSVSNIRVFKCFIVEERTYREKTREWFFFVPCSNDMHT